jgi:hypothetical protein
MPAIALSVLPTMLGYTIFSFEKIKKLHNAKPGE